jgi:transposase
MLRQFSKTIAAHRSSILAYFEFYSLSTGPLENANNKSKTLHKMAYGFRDAKFFKLKIMVLHEAILLWSVETESTHFPDELAFN